MYPPGYRENSYNPYTQDGDDCPPWPMDSGRMNYSGSDKETIPEPARTYNKNIPRDDFYCALEISEVVHSTAKAICVKPKGYDVNIWIPNSCFIYCLPTMVKVKSSFLQTKLKDFKKGLHTVIGTQLERCPYCGKDTGCDCASPGHKPKVTLIPAPPADLAAQIAKAKLKKFVEENR